MCLLLPLILLFLTRKSAENNLFVFLKVRVGLRTYYPLLTFHLWDFIRFVEQPNTFYTRVHKSSTTFNSIALCPLLEKIHEMESPFIMEVLTNFQIQQWNSRVNMLFKKNKDSNNNNKANEILACHLNTLNL